MPHEVVLQTSLPLPLFGRGKVRDTYDLGDRLLMVATDRLSAFDAILPNGIPDKGRVLTLLSAFWFGRTREIISNHLISIETTELPESLGATAESLTGRFMLVRKAKRLDFECVVRGYLAGSGWADYQRTGAVCGVKLPMFSLAITAPFKYNRPTPLALSYVIAMCWKLLAFNSPGALNIGCHPPPLSTMLAIKSPGPLFPNQSSEWVRCTP